MRRLIWALTIALATPANAQQAADSVAPEISSGTAVQVAAPVAAKDWMVAAANPHAVRAGAKVLEQGGSAADAMIAVQTVLGLVEPQSSGLGGGGFLVWYDGETRALTTLDGRETAPLAATPTLFQDENGVPLEFFDAVVGGRSVGVPGIPALMQAAHDRWGQLPWADLFDPAITLAQTGFAVSPRLATLVADDQERLSRYPATAAYFVPNGTPLGQGDILKNPEYAQLLQTLAADGAKAFYTGPIAGDIAAKVQGLSDNPGHLSPTDLAIYQVRERPATCAPYRGYEVCGMGPPSSGAVAVGQILGQLAQYDLPNMDAKDPEVWRLIGDSTRLAFADRGRYLADSDFVPVPVKGLLDAEYLKARGALMAGQRLQEVAPGNPEFDHALNWADDAAIELPSTSHITIKDRYGNVLSMTSSVENAFGSRVMVHGMLLNNQLTDFSFKTHADGVPVANRVEPGKRPRSSMAPTIVMKDGAPVLALGSPGGSRIIPYVAQTLIAYLDWEMDIQAAISLPHLLNRFGGYDIEAGTPAEALAPPLTEMGYEVSLRPLTSGLQGIAIGPDGLQGGADPRREGIVLGE